MDFNFIIFYEHLNKSLKPRCCKKAFLLGLPVVAESTLSCIFFLIFRVDKLNYCIIPIGFAKHAIFFGRHCGIARVFAQTTV